jgi:hypothetical protein
MSVFIFPLWAQDYDNDFQNATKMAAYGTESAGGTDLLVRDTTSVLHRENMAILDELAKLHKEIADLKKDVKAIKGQVE